MDFLVLFCVSFVSFGFMYWGVKRALFWNCGIPIEDLLIGLFIIGGLIILILGVFLIQALFYFDNYIGAFSIALFLLISLICFWKSLEFVG